jgi:hypothetical protein
MEDNRMKKPVTLVCEIEWTQARIAVLSEDHARIGQEISHLIRQNKARITELVGATVERLDLSGLPVHVLLSSLSKLGEGLVIDRDLSTGLPEAQANIQVFVKFGRNASASNRQLLLAAGLHWHGRHGGWSGCVTRERLAHLRRVFGRRVEKPEEVSTEGDARASPENAPGAVSADLEAIAAPAEGEQGQVEAAAPGDKSVSTATTRLRSTFGFPSRRPIAT